MSENTTMLSRCKHAVRFTNSPAFYSSLPTLSFRSLIIRLFLFCAYYSMPLFFLLSSRLFVLFCSPETRQVTGPSIPTIDSLHQSCMPPSFLPFCVSSLSCRWSKLTSLSRCSTRSTLWSMRSKRRTKKSASPPWR